MEKVFTEKLNWSYIRRGIILFVICTVVGFVFLFFYQQKTEFSPLKFTEIIKQIHLQYLVLLGFMVILDWLLGALRLFIFIPCVSSEVKFYDCFRANLANMFLGAVTPSQTGGGVAHLYILNRAGCPLAAAIAFSFINFLSVVAALFGSALLISWLNPPFLGGKITLLIKSSMILIFLWGLYTAFALVFPSLALLIWEKMLSPLRHFHKIKSLLNYLQNFLQNYGTYANFYIMKKPQLLLMSIIITFFLYLNKFLIAYVILALLRINANLLSVLAVQALLFLITYVSPSPGASGVAEISAGYLMGKLIPVSYLSLFTFFWRCFTVYFAMFLGAFYLFKQLHRDLS